jgi:hypothetical protein
MTMMRVELFYDEDGRNWHYRVPALRINGGAPGRLPTLTRFQPRKSLENGALDD